MKIAIVAGALANKPGNGGAAWTRLSWALGIQRLGFEVWFLEQIERASLVDSNGMPGGLQASANRAWFRRVTERFGLGGRAVLIVDDGAGIEGLSPGELEDLGADAALLINISGNLKHPAVLGGGARKLYLDLDPGYTQFWHAQGLLDQSFERHDLFFTIGEAIGSPRCPVPTGGIAWRAARQPLLLEHWPVAEGERDRFTTVASWRDPYGRVCHDGREYGLKVHAFREFIELPRLIDQRCELALDIDPADRADRERLRAHGWQLADPAVEAGDPDLFRRYVQNSGAEFSIAKGVYADTRCGWFSDRSVRYLASGKPVLVQDTGSAVPAGTGLIHFRSLDQAVDGAARIARDYEAHSAAARALAETWFDSDRVLSRLLDETGVAP